MKCKTIEQNIYGYRELGEVERKRVDEHIQQCVTCMNLFVEMQQQYTLLGHVATTKRTLEKPLDFTERVMRKIEPAKKAQQRGLRVSFMDLLSVRYALAGVSALLVITFFIEQQSPPQAQDQTEIQIANETVLKGEQENKPTENSSISSTKKPVVLNTTSFLKNIRNKKSTANSGKITSLYTCLKNPDCDYSLIRSFKQKKSSQHENI
jgi:hypothetical protein